MGLHACIRVQRYRRSGYPALCMQIVKESVAVVSMSSGEKEVLLVSSECRERVCMIRTGKGCPAPDGRLTDASNCRYALICSAAMGLDCGATRHNLDICRYSSGDRPFSDSSRPFYTYSASVRGDRQDSLCCGNRQGMHDGRSLEHELPHNERFGGLLQPDEGFFVGQELSGRFDSRNTLSPVIYSCAQTRPLHA